MTDIVPPTEGSDRTADNFAEAHISTITWTFTAFFFKGHGTKFTSRSTGLSAQSRLDSHDTLATTTPYHNVLDVLLANPLLLGLPQAWEYPVSLFDGGMANSTLNDGLEMKLTQSQLAHRTSIFRGSTGAPSKGHHSHIAINQAPVPVSVIEHPKLSYRRPGGIRNDHPLIPPFQVCFPTGPPTESAQKGASTSTIGVPELDNSHDIPFNAPFRSIRPPVVSWAVPSQPRLPHIHY